MKTDSGSDCDPPDASDTQCASGEDPLTRGVSFQVNETEISPDSNQIKKISKQQLQLLASRKKRKTTATVGVVQPISNENELSPDSDQIKKIADQQLQLLTSRKKKKTAATVEFIQPLPNETKLSAESNQIQKIAEQQLQLLTCNIKIKTENLEAENQLQRLTSNKKRKTVPRTVKRLLDKKTSKEIQIQNNIQNLNEIITLPDVNADTVQVMQPNVLYSGYPPWSSVHQSPIGAFFQTEAIIENGLSPNSTRIKNTDDNSINSMLSRRGFVWNKKRMLWRNKHSVSIAIDKLASN